jgi:hypothetical protein
VRDKTTRWPEDEAVPLVPVQRPRSALQAAFWLLPFGVLSGAGDDGPATLAVGLALGVAWQLVYRRDLVDRLTVVAVFLTVGAATAFLMRAVAGNVTVDLSHAGGALACLAGLVLTEQALRARDLRAHRRAATSPAEAVPARP